MNKPLAIAIQQFRGEEVVIGLVSGTRVRGELRAAGEAAVWVQDRRSGESHFVNVQHIAFCHPFPKKGGAMTDEPVRPGGPARKVREMVESISPTLVPENEDRRRLQNVAILENAVVGLHTRMCDLEARVKVLSGLVTELEDVLIARLRPGAIPASQGGGPHATSE